ncbi:ATP-binding protein [Hoyosella rhizosphaerae]|uniref:Histidine kinase/HSP90-like ATPase domain-containing protein n=1 Tax=Hoyosella rhizosphaerae TaxID=1755582 RepID=A0A916U7T8_9ACTN|nr:ATP-binding protein [Hoyosella rhizosphaerae]MBN4927528.1 ATP-binding protein [Hoyosella rhizosphaerae]GGC63790.1 hypothetical protein GCM10011410_15270 [Hoyosella rhizosphaerae]
MSATAPAEAQPTATVSSDVLRTSSFERVFRIFALLVGFAGVSLGFLNQARIINESAFMAAWWSVPAVISVFATSAILLVGSHLLPISVLRVLLRIHSVGFVVALVTWPLAFPGVALDTHFASWLWSVNALAAMAAAVAWPARVALTYLAVVPMSSVFLNAYAVTTPHWGTIIEDIAMATTAATVYVSMALISLQTGRSLDNTRWHAYSRAANTAAAIARNQERERIDGLIHDGVISTLLNASRGGDTHVLARQARKTIDQLHLMRIGLESSEPFPVDDAIAFLRSTAVDISEDIPVVVSCAPKQQGSNSLIPATVVRALSAGLAEALRNSFRHAAPNGERVQRSVTITVDSRGCTIVVSDNGVGFSLKNVPENRLGLAVSIRGRMSRLAGGFANIDSAPNSGTTVKIGWIRPR